MQKNKKIIPSIILTSIVIVFIISFIRGSILVKKSEKELNTKSQSSEAQASKYNLKEIDAKTGDLRWELSAKGGMTENGLESAYVEDISAKVYKNNTVIFELNAPYAKANSTSMEIYLFGDVTAKDQEGKFYLKSNQLALGMGTSIEAQKGFTLLLTGTGTVIGDNAIINDDQSKIIVKDLKEATFKEIIISGEKVVIEKDKAGNLLNANISMGGKIILGGEDKSILSAKVIKWKNNGEVEASDDVIYISKDKVFKAGFIHLNKDKKLTAKNNVQILHEKTQCYGNALNYDNNSQIIITGKPHAVQGNKQISADKIVYDINTKQVQALGNVRTIVLENKKT